MVMPGWLEKTTIGETLSGYFRHPERKADGSVGVLGVKSMIVTSIKYIGKEINEVLEEVSEDSAGWLGGYTEITYREANNLDLKRKIRHYGIDRVVKTSGLSKSIVYRLLNGTKPHYKTVGMLNKAFEKLEKSVKISTI